MYFVQPVKMSNSDNFSSNIIIESVYSVSVNETVSNPDTSLNTILDFTTHLHGQ